MTLLAFTDLGLVRRTNQDAALARVEGARVVLVVADGMGGRPAGDVAAGLVVRAFEAESGVEPPAVYLEARVRAASAAIASAVVAQSERTGMGSTVVAALVESAPNGDTLWLAHLGDSRAYLWDEDAPPEHRLQRLTRDHSVAQLAIDAGTLTPLDARHDPRRAQLTRALGDEYRGCEPAGPLRLSPRACLLLVSDGVCGVLPDEGIALLAGMQRGAALAEALRDAVHAAGAPDNLAIALLDRRAT